MRTWIRISAVVAILSGATVVGIQVYLAIGRALGQVWSSFSEAGPHWPFTVTYLAVPVGLFAFVSWFALVLQKDKLDRRFGQHR
ncbi:hypothetical protein [Arthrobacter sp. LjRoot14]|uniref:hypothetical protein n=1 Tax=Arthrobacter sp. LjRoot14 TaxID=3342265 RepID=UPI003ECC8B44